MVAALSVVAAGCGSGDLLEVELLGVDGQRSQIVVGVVRATADCEQPLRVKAVAKNGPDPLYEVTCAKDGVIFDATRTHTVFCADGKWRKVGYLDVGTVGNSCTPEGE